MPTSTPSSTTVTPTAEPDPATARVNAALEAGDVEGAMIAAHAAMAADPTEPRVHHAAARAARAVSELHLACRHIEIALSLAPEASDLYVEQGDLLRQLGRPADAMVAYEHASRLCPDSIDALIGRIRLAASERREAEAVALAERLLLIGSDDGAARIAVSEVLFDTGRVEEALELLDETLDRHGWPDAVANHALFLRASVLDRLKRHDEAWADLTAANTNRGADFDPVGLDAYGQAIIDAFPAPCRKPAASSEPASPQPVFIVGMMRSGTSLLEQILDGHGAIRGAGEFCLANRLIRRVGSMTGGGVAYPEDLDRLDEGTWRALADFAGETLKQEACATPIVIDKTPGSFIHLGFLARLLPAMRVIWCRRDALDTCLSCYFQRFATEHPWAFSLEGIGAFRGFHDRLLTHWRGHPGLTIHEVEYESLVEDPEAVVRGVLEFLGVLFEPECLAFHDRHREVHTASREQVRRPLYRSSVGRARHYAQYLAPLEAVIGHGS